jgi:iron complex transport system ATP-binding protein
VSAAIHLAAVGFAYRKAPVFRDFNLAVGAGSMTALLGPNGSGKTTFVRLACGSRRPSTGSVALFGDDLVRLPARERALRVAVVPQDSPAVFEFTVMETVLLGRFPHLGFFGIESDGDLAIAREALERADASHLAARPFRALSGGERQRVLVARALAQQSRIVILDEPTAYLDLRHRLELYDLLARLNREEGLTVVVVSHDLNLAARHCDRLVLLRCGTIAADGTPDEVLAPEPLRAVYEVDVDVRADPVTGRPHVVPRAPAPRRPGPS